jgi:hypothetical protein
MFGFAGTKENPKRQFTLRKARQNQNEFKAIAINIVFPCLTL